MYPIHSSAVAACALSIAFTSGVGVAAIAPGQSDDFEGGTTLGWSVGPVSAVPPEVITSDGPGGSTDAYLLLRATGVQGPGGRLVAFNAGSWAGDYLEAGVSAITMQVRNLGTSDLALRLILEGGTFETVATLEAVSLPAGSGWMDVTFSLAPAALGGGNFQNVMGDVTALNLVHSPGFVTARSQTPNVAAVLGVDNVTAVPEPRMAVLTGVGVAALLLRFARRRRS